MRWRGGAPPTAVAALVTAVAVLVAPALAGAASSHPPPAVRVTPGSGSPHTRFVVSFLAPARIGPAGPPAHGSVQERYYVVEASHAGASHRCDPAAGATVTAARKGQRSHVKLVPTGAGWCRGTYTGTVDEDESTACSAGVVCPQFIAVVRRVGRVRFAVH